MFAVLALAVGNISTSSRRADPVTYPLPVLYSYPDPSPVYGGFVRGYSQ